MSQCFWRWFWLHFVRYYIPRDGDRWREWVSRRAGYIQ